MTTQMEQTTYVVQRRKPQRGWVDTDQFDTEEAARLLLDGYSAELTDLLGPFRIVRRTDAVI